ncbi:hypothetical protein [Streptomyces gougerotii]
MTTEPEQQFGVGTPDAFQRLWTPHRMAYIQGENKPTGPGAGDGCPFCVVPAKSDEDGLIVRRGTHAYAVLNLYRWSDPRGGPLLVGRAPGVPGGPDHPSWKRRDRRAFAS